MVRSINNAGKNTNLRLLPLHKSQLAITIKVNAATSWLLAPNTGHILFQLPVKTRKPLINTTTNVAKNLLFILKSSSDIYLAILVAVSRVVRINEFSIKIAISPPFPKRTVFVTSPYPAPKAPIGPGPPFASIAFKPPGAIPALTASIAITARNASTIIAP